MCDKSGESSQPLFARGLAATNPRFANPSLRIRFSQRIRVVTNPRFAAYATLLPTVAQKGPLQVVPAAHQVGFPPTGKKGPHLTYTLLHRLH